MRELARGRRNEISKATADRINCRPKERSDARFCARSPPVICKGHRRNPRATDTRGKGRAEWRCVGEGAEVEVAKPVEKERRLKEFA